MTTELNEETKETVQEATEEATKEAPQESSDNADDELERLRDQHLRLRAEFENFRRRTRQEMVELKAAAAEELVASLLPVIDNLERAIAAAGEGATAVQGIKNGVEMVLKQFLGELHKVGVTPIDAMGAPFDPRFHEAVAHEETDAAPDGHVIEVVQKGYSLNDKVLRPSMVKVAKGRTAREAATDE